MFEFTHTHTHTKESQNDVNYLCWKFIGGAVIYLNMLKDGIRFHYEKEAKDAKPKLSIFLFVEARKSNIFTLLFVRSL